MGEFHFLHCTYKLKNMQPLNRNNNIQNSLKMFTETTCSVLYFYLFKSDRKISDGSILFGFDSTFYAFLRL